jgi:chromosome segregation ATPase
MVGERHADAENRIRAALQQLLTGDIPEGLKCDVKSLCVLSAVPRATLYRTYPHLRVEFERQRSAARDAGQQPDPRLAQIQRLKDDATQLRERLATKDTELDTLKAFQAEALSRLTAQHDEITALRQELHAHPGATIRTLPAR